MDAPVIDQCGLRRDLEILDAGDLTEVGEKGLTLRYALLARAHDGWLNRCMGQRRAKGAYMLPVGSPGL